MRGAAWDDGRLAILQRLWAEGKKASEIAKQLGGISRAAVLGKIHRLRLDAGDPGKTPAKGKARKKALPAAPKDSAPSRRRGGSKDQAAPVRPEAGTGPRMLFELTNACCRWPYEKPGKRYYFCADAGADVVNGIPYCPRHMRRAYLIPPVMVKPLRPVSARAA